MHLFYPLFILRIERVREDLQDCVDGVGVPRERGHVERRAAGVVTLQQRAARQQQSKRRF